MSHENKPEPFDELACDTKPEAEVTPRPPDDERAGQILCKCGHAKVQHHVSGSGWGDCYTPDCPCRFYVRVPAEPPAREPLSPREWLIQNIREYDDHSSIPSSSGWWKGRMSAYAEYVTASLRAQLAQAETERNDLQLSFEHALDCLDEKAVSLRKAEAALAQAQQERDALIERTRIAILHSEEAERYHEEAESKLSQTEAALRIRAQEFVRDSKTMLGLKTVNEAENFIYNHWLTQAAAQESAASERKDA